MKKKLNYFVVTLLFIGFLTIKCDVVNAAQVGDTTLPETVTRGEIQYTFGPKGIKYQDGITSYPFYNESSDGKYQLYCSDRNNGVYKAGDVLTKGDSLGSGIATLLSWGFSNQGPTAYANFFNNGTYIPSSENDPVPTRMLNTWITQVAIWAYQGTISYDDVYYLDDNDDKIKGYRLQYKPENGPENSNYELYLDAAFKTGVYGDAMWKQYISKIVADAKSNPPENAQLSIKVDGNWSKINGTNNSKSGLISISQSSSVNLDTYALSIDNAPAGTRVYTEDGKDITGSLNAIPASQKVYLVVNRDNVKDDVKFTVRATATLTYSAAYQYVDKVNNHQPSVLVGPESKDLNAALEMTLSPDTALSVSNSIYFLGFMILISGAFIIYANVKTKKESAE